MPHHLPFHPHFFRVFFLPLPHHHPLSISLLQPEESNKKTLNSFFTRPTLQLIYPHHPTLRLISFLLSLGTNWNTFIHVRLRLWKQGFNSIYDDCVAPLLDALFHGYNATILAYGQTRSGKPYTMGTNYTGDESSCGIIPQVMNSIFAKIEARKEATEFILRVSFIEIFKEEVFDLLDPNSSTSSRGKGALAKLAAPTRNPIQIRETTNGGITLVGVTEAELRTEKEMASFLSRGALARATGSLI